MIITKKIFLCFLILAFTIVLGCKDSLIDYRIPVIELAQQDTLNIKVGHRPSIPIKITANNGARSIRIFKDRKFLTEYSLPANSNNYTFEADELPETLTEGEEFTYGFVVTNLNGTDSDFIDVLIRVDLYDSIKVGNRKLYTIPTPTNGEVKSGTTLKLAKGRNYLLSKSLTFTEGSKLVIEEGVNVFMKSDTAGSVGLKMMGQMDIAGSAANPVVFTSSKVLTGTPAGGDWKSLELEGNGIRSFGKISYLRMEYGGKATFSLSNVSSETSIDHVQVFKSSGDGLLVTDGDVNLKYIVSTDCAGSAFKLTGNYKGKMQSLISSISQGSSTEKYELEISAGTKPLISNATILGNGTTTSKTYGIKLGGSKIYNTIISQFPERGIAGSKNDMDTSAVFANSYVFKIERDPFFDLTQKFEGTFAADTTGNILTNPFVNNVLSKKNNVYQLDTIPGINVNAFIPQAEKVSTYDPSITDTKFFSKSLFVGAIKNSSDDWTKGWVRNADGSLR